MIELRKNNVKTKGIASSPSVTCQEASASVAHLSPESTSIKDFALKSFGSNEPDSGVREYIHKRANIDDLAQMIRNTLDAER